MGYCVGGVGDKEGDPVGGVGLVGRPVGERVGKGVSGPSLTRNRFGVDELVGTLFITPFCPHRRRMAFTSAVVAQGYSWRIVAATPATSGDDIEVPLRNALRSGDPMYAPWMLEPGANMSTQDP